MNRVPLGLLTANRATPRKSAVHFPPPAVKPFR